MKTSALSPGKGSPELKSEFSFIDKRVASAEFETPDLCFHQKSPPEREKNHEPPFIVLVHWFRLYHIDMGQPSFEASNAIVYVTYGVFL